MLVERVLLPALIPLAIVVGDGRATVEAEGRHRLDALEARRVDLATQNILHVLGVIQEQTFFRLVQQLNTVAVIILLLDVLYVDRLQRGIVL